MTSTATHSDATSGNLSVISEPESIAFSHNNSDSSLSSFTNEGTQSDDSENKEMGHDTDMDADDEFEDSQAGDKLDEDNSDEDEDSTYQHKNRWARLREWVYQEVEGMYASRYEEV